MTDPKPPAGPEKDSPAKNRRVLLLLAGGVMAIVLLLGGIEAFSQLSKRTPEPGPVAEGATEPAPQAAVEPPVAELQPEPQTVVRPEPAAVVEPEPEPAPPEPVAEAPEPEIAVETPVAPVETPDPQVPELPAAPVEAQPDPAAAAVAEVAEPAAVDLAVTKAKGEPPVRQTGDIAWAASVYPSLSSQYAGTITFADGGTATVVFNRSFVTAALTLDLIAKDGPLQGVAAVAVLRADGKDIAIEVGLEHATLLESGASDGSFQSLLDATKLLLALLYENGDTAVLTLTKPAGDELEAVLFPGRQQGQ